MGVNDMQLSEVWNAKYRTWTIVSHICTARNTSANTDWIFSIGGLNLQSMVHSVSITIVTDSFMAEPMIPCVHSSQEKNASKQSKQ
uniref:Uncharacterized protein n=1 Tax=Romanomermis culicivorax TaxID=13658 RepID=A0A915HEQ5_ROMCU